jgi:hypothetical protein
MAVSPAAFGSLWNTFVCNSAHFGGMDNGVARRSESQSIGTLQERSYGFSGVYKESAGTAFA